VTATGLALEGTPFAARLGARFVQLAERRTPLLVANEERTRLRLEVVAPAGLAARPAAEESLVTPFGKYTRRDRLDGGLLVREEELVVLRGRVLPGQYTEFARFATGVDAAQERAVVMDPTPGDAQPSIPRS